MAYAAAHSPAVTLAGLDTESATATSQEALASLFPAISASTAAQFGWGRNIDPQTNTYSNVTTFSNGYGLYASVTLFDGGSTWNRYLHARGEKKRSLNAVRLQSDDAAVAAMLAYADALYQQSAARIAADKLEHSRALLRLITREEELGVKSAPDVAEARAAEAGDKYQLVNKRNLYLQSMIRLRKVMNLPDSVQLAIDSAGCRTPLSLPSDQADDIYKISASSNPKALDAQFEVNSYEYLYKAAKGNMFPTLSLNAGISTSYFKTLTGGAETTPFSTQFRNNRGEYVSATISIPLFDGMSRHSAMRRARVNLAKARVRRDDTLRSLHDDITAALLDRDGCAAEITALEARVSADEQSLHMNRRRFEEGLISMTDMLLSADKYYESRTELLRTRLAYMVKCRMLNYYKGECLWM